MRLGPPGATPAWFAQREESVIRGLALVGVPE
jgi:hypothetical protein